MEKPYRSYSGKRNELLYELADQFLELGKKGFERKTKDFEPQPFASLVNLAFAAELFLKYLIEENSEKGWGHNLKKLFNKLDENDRNTIYMSLIFSYSQKGRVDELKNGKMTELLENHSNLFEDFRYLYENPGRAFKSDKVDFGFLMDFVVITKGLCDQRKSDSKKRN
ncbi:hypothetical protein [Salegentibacter salarius]|uniref:HEPN domain-containing protein n=1 Tax=Salegentibacter salarius TaxID=435906 RepID=A0A2N0TQF6_9FLAO|nr:hypothetical protein [Salegentibacter salarius]OEY71725.1 hypothetical protein BHS39_15040 [Salegentibacter salarius]PKD16961.1 hypothetical protein APR40_15010 [Salegentibacter salarius]SLJ89778.1 hypothetical protein SAMN05660445_00868 [Salegentibacter salarius]